MPDIKHVDHAGSPDPNSEVKHNDHTPPGEYHGADRAMEHAKKNHRADRPGAAPAAPHAEPDGDE